jgi:hypothetical protein
MDHCQSKTANRWFPCAASTARLDLRLALRSGGDDHGTKFKNAFNAFKFAAKSVFL